MHPKTFKRTVAKFAMRHIVWSVSTSLVESTAHQFLDVEEDSAEEAGIHLGALVTGFAVSRKLEPLTDEMVDRVANWRVARKAAKADTSEVTE